MNLFTGIQSELAKLSPPVRALVSALAIVLVLYMIPPTKKYAVWAGVAIIVLWSLKLFAKNKGN